MNIKRQLIKGESVNIPCVILTPENSIGAAVIVHGYGGCKEEQLGLAFRVAEIGITTCVIDLSGHGENQLPLDENVLLDVETAIKYCRSFGKVAAIGHSLGGALSLISNADYAIGISPAISTSFNANTKELLKNLRSYRVRCASVEKLFQILENIPQGQIGYNKKTAIIYGGRDIPDIISACDNFKAKGFAVSSIDNALHNDIFLLEETFHRVIGQLREWFKEE